MKKRRFTEEQIVGALFVVSIALLFFLGNNKKDAQENNGADEIAEIHGHGDCIARAVIDRRTHP